MKLLAASSSSENVGDYNHPAVKKNTKFMIHEALTELKSRKGVSYYAIKKFISTNYDYVDIDKINHVIKKQLKAGIEDGSIVQTRGIGAAGSFKLVQTKDEKKKKKIKKSQSQSGERVIKEKKDKQVKFTGEEMKKISKDKKKSKKKTDDLNTKVEKKSKKESSISSGSKKTTKKKKQTGVEEKAMKKPRDVKTPPKKRERFIKRKSIGSIIKPPKMKPKSIK